MVAIRKTIIALLLSGFAAWLVFSVWVHISYASNLPDAPDEKIGRIHKLVVNHGFVRYGTERELHRLLWAQNSQMIAIVLFLSAFILGIRWGIFHVRVGRKSDTAI